MTRINLLLPNYNTVQTFKRNGDKSGIYNPAQQNHSVSFGGKTSSKEKWANIKDKTYNALPSGVQEKVNKHFDFSYKYIDKFAKACHISDPDKSFEECSRILDNVMKENPKTQRGFILGRNSDNHTVLECAIWKNSSNPSKDKDLSGRIFDIVDSLNKEAKSRFVLDRDKVGDRQFDYALTYKRPDIALRIMDTVKDLSPEVQSLFALNPNPYWGTPRIPTELIDVSKKPENVREDYNKLKTEFFDLAESADDNTKYKLVFADAFAQPAFKFAVFVNNSAFASDFLNFVKGLKSDKAKKNFILIDKENNQSQFHFASMRGYNNLAMDFLDFAAEVAQEDKEVKDVVTQWKIPEAIRANSRYQEMVKKYPDILRK